jgi:aspartyl-tRNA(Asn)/glutamyl-tRNA(Gln) amidotransferase subunit A
MPACAEDLAFAPLSTLANLIRKKKISPVELVDGILARIEQFNPRLNCYLTVLAREARQEAALAARAISKGKYLGPLHGIPVAIKDNIWTRGVRTTAGSKVLADFVPQEDAALVARLRRAGAVILGKTNLHEFAYGVTSANLHFGAVRNPWDLERIPGGSSGGSAAALAAGLCCAAIGTDTGGSIRIPAACCGVVGLKPTFGRVSCYGVIPLARSLDHAGPIARTVADAAILLQAMAGIDPRDPVSVDAPVPDFSRELGKPLGKMRLGWPRDFFFDRVDEQVRRAVEAARAVFEELGAKFEEVALPSAAGSLRPATQIALAEAAQYHRSAGFFPARAGDYSDEVRARLESGSKISAIEYLEALELRKLLRQEFDAAFGKVSAIVAPTIPLAAPRIGEETVQTGGEQEDVRNAMLRFNRPSNLTGLPAISVPCGFTTGGLPIGLQIIGRTLDEARVLRLAAAFEGRTDWHTRRPALA